jgi:predicted dithiol-disulfide oxidoreductase (DUF899 family)
MAVASDQLHEVRFPGESDEYRAARDALLRAEIELREPTEAVAAQRRRLPLGGEVPGQDPRHVEFMWPLWHILDTAPLGRDPDWSPKLQYG